MTRRRKPKITTQTSAASLPMQTMPDDALPEFYVCQATRGAAKGFVMVPLKLNPSLTRHYRAISERRPMERTA